MLHDYTHLIIHAIQSNMCQHGSGKFLTIQEIG